MKAFPGKFTRNIGPAFLAAVFLLGPLLNAQTASPANSQPSSSVPGDRWMEMDLYWFDQADIAGSVGKFWDRFQPIYAGVRGYRGVILNVGWTVSCVMEWSGDFNQAITLPKGTGQAHWVEEKGPLTGTTEEREKKAAERFTHPIDVPHQGYDAWTYGDLRKLTAALRDEGARRGIGGFKVGLLNLAWNGAYKETGAWTTRHPEAFPYPGPYGRLLDPGALLHADPGHYGGFPQGIAEGTPFHRAYAAQWGSLSKACGLDAVMLRDSFGALLPYERGGPWGSLAPSPEVIRKSTAATAALVRETKQANPQALVMMYSSGSSAVGDWRCNGFDLEAIAKEGYLDAYVDQTWAGAWNEVGVRRNFWNYPACGWTYQLAFMLLHSAMLAETKARHYPLVEAVDAWEDQDIIHTAPERLRWAMWAYSHAAVKTPQGLKFPDGSYISWPHQGKKLISADDVRFLTGNLNAAVKDASQTTEIFGPTVVYCRSAMQWQADHAVPGYDIKEWIDEQVGSIIKWPVPVLSVTRVEWLPQVKSDLFIVQTPSHLAPSEKTALVDLIEQGQPMAIFGNPNGGIDPELGALGGLLRYFTPLGDAASLGMDNSSAKTDPLLAELSKLKLDLTTYNKQANPRPAELTDKAQALAKNVPPAFTTNDPIGNVATKEATVVYSMDNAPMLTLNIADGKNIVMWDPPELRYVFGSLADTWNGDGADYVLAAGALNCLLDRENALHAQEIDLRQTMNVTAWRTRDGAVRIMAGNLEEGLRDDADLSRHARMVLPGSWPTDWRDAWSDRQEKSEDGKLQLDLSQASSVLLRSVPSP